MELSHAIILGIIQGLTEVLPISSSGHLLLLPAIMDWPHAGLTFDVALHLGTFLALLYYFRHDVITMVQEGLHGFTRAEDRGRLQLPWLIVLGSIPAAIVGKTMEAPIEAIFRSSTPAIALFLIIFGLVLGAADYFGKKRLTLDGITLYHAMIIGCAQCLALLPGVSRSGITITAALILGFCRADAARFSFLLSLPIVFGAALLKTIEALQQGISHDMLVPMAAGIVSSALAGYCSVAFLLKFVQSRSLWAFTWYRLLLGGIILLWI